MIKMFWSTLYKINVQLGNRYIRIIVEQKEFVILGATKYTLDNSYQYHIMW